jgi:hypothetical protein
MTNVLVRNGLGLAILAAVAIGGGALADGQKKIGKPTGDAEAQPMGDIDVGKFTAEGVCGAAIPVVLDGDSFRAGFKTLQIPVQGAGHDSYSIDDGIRNARSTCRYAMDVLKSFCSQSSGHKDAVAAKLKSVRCALLDDSDIEAAPRESLDNGVWTIKFTWWADNTADEPELQDPLNHGLAKRLGVEPRAHDPMDDGHGPEPKRCRAPKDCAKSEVCASAGAVKGPRCRAPSPAKCTKGGSSFGHEDAKCPSGQSCTQYGVCFPKGEFPAHGQDLPKRASCYAGDECASQSCKYDGSSTRFGRIGTCG